MAINWSIPHFCVQTNSRIHGLADLRTGHSATSGRATETKAEGAAFHGRAGSVGWLEHLRSAKLRRETRNNFL